MRQLSRTFNFFEINLCIPIRYIAQRTNLPFVQTVKTCIKLKFGVDIVVPMWYHIIVPDRYTKNKQKGEMKKWRRYYTI